jgi:hypothetical protein
MDVISSIRASSGALNTSTEGAWGIARQRR